MRIAVSASGPVIAGQILQSLVTTTTIIIIRIRIRLLLLLLLLAYVIIQTQRLSGFVRFCEKFYNKINNSYSYYYYDYSCCYYYYLNNNKRIVKIH